ncbi:hypothetical protein [Paractinoplanes lichenicola]|uniref:Uncharacterized protein n=1 Tax=Paractinoplanes lichenicola TaxID=2802976 RepID=A0ABS1VH65_9ACTN|nr:hypothetical protein [Actinoplanes lichenicola]MBL7253499.1 hypothetical protein [Actinoplanes lichenicola]
MPSEQSHLKRMILSQSVEGTAIPMVLFSDDTLAEAGPADQPEVVTRTAAGLGIDPDGLELFSFDAYRLQSALGEGLAP